MSTMSEEQTRDASDFGRLAVPMAGLRVLELAGMVAGPYCGKLIAGLGAEVVKVEPPLVGDPARRRGPFPGDVPNPERSGTFLYLNTGKKGITLNLDDPQGRHILRQLAESVDVLIHDLPPRQAEKLGISDESSTRPLVEP